MRAANRSFLLQLITLLGLGHNIEQGDDSSILEVFWSEDDDETDEESMEARERIIKKYDQAERVLPKTKDQELEEKKQIQANALLEWKKTYYKV